MAQTRRRYPGAASLLQGLALVGVCALSLQVFFALRIAAMAVLDPASTAFQRSEAWRLLRDRGSVRWHQAWVDVERISVHAQRAVIASEDAGFAQHAGVDWGAFEKAWEQRQRMQNRAAAQASSTAGAGRGNAPRLAGGSTITQQLAKNLFLSAERTVARKAQELLITWMLEALLPKRRLLEIYLNSVEWGEGVFGIQAAAWHHFRTDAGRLGPAQAARLAVMLPAPKRFEKLPNSPYVAARAATIAERMPAITLP